MTKLDKILELTLQVEQAIESGDWGTANEIESNRRQLLIGLFNDNSIQTMSPGDQAALKNILLRNEESIRNVHAGRKELTRHSSRINNATAAARAYRSNSAQGRERLVTSG